MLETYSLPVTDKVGSRSIIGWVLMLKVVSSHDIAVSNDGRSVVYIQNLRQGFFLLFNLSCGLRITPRMVAAYRNSEIRGFHVTSFGGSGGIAAELFSSSGVA